MITSESINEIAGALSQAQGEFPQIPKNQEVEVKKDNRLLYKFKYADLTQIIDSTRPALMKNGLSFTQTVVRVPDVGLGYITRILHKSGQWIETGFIPAVINNNSSMKDIAGVSTYGKRLSLSEALGVSADEDADAPLDSGESATMKPLTRAPDIKPVKLQEPVKPKNHAPSKAGGLSEAQVIELHNRIKGIGWNVEQYKSFIKAIYGIDKTEDLKPNQYKDIQDMVITPATPYIKAMTIPKGN